MQDVWLPIIRKTTMDPITHTVIAVGSMIVSYFAGYYVAKRQHQEMLFAIFEKLEKEGKLIFNDASGKLS